MNNFMPNESHKANSKAARAGRRVSAPTWKPRRHKVVLSQDDNGSWMVYINKSPNGLPASDVEVSLWLELQEVKKQLEQVEHHVDDMDSNEF